MRGETVTENIIEEDEVLLEPELNSNAGHANSRHPTRSKLWDHPEEDLPLLDSPLEVDSETPVADALIKRLQDEEEKQEGTCEAAYRPEIECLIKNNTFKNLRWCRRDATGTLPVPLLTLINKTHCSVSVSHDTF